MRDHLAAFGDATIAVVTFAAPGLLAAYRDHLALPFPIVSDPDRALYRLVGAERGSRRQVWSLRTLRAYAFLLCKGRRLRRPTEDIRQLGAEVVVGRDGVVRYLHLPATPASRPPIQALIDALD